jgi:hypothetical protein
MGPILQILLGMFFCACPVRLLMLNYRWARKGIKTTGTIINITTIGDPNDWRSYGPVDTPEIRFYDEMNNQHTVESPLGLGKGNFNVGDKITVYYNPQNLSQISVDNGGFKLVMVLFFLGGVSQIVLGILFWLDIIH